MNTCRLVVLSDLQIDYQDNATLDAVCSFLSDFQPNTLVFNGDIIDATALSPFGRALEERAGLMAQVDKANYWLERLMEYAQHPNTVYVDGNHEARLERYLRDIAPELAETLSLDSLLDFERLGITHITPYGAAYEWHGVYITHGRILRANASKANFDHEGSSGVSGHTHRLGSYFRTDRRGQHGWFEGGCLCEVRGAYAPPPHNPGINDWQQGFIVGYGVHGTEFAHTSKQWNLYPVCITEHRFVWNGRLYAPTS